MFCLNFSIFGKQCRVMELPEICLYILNCCRTSAVLSERGSQNSTSVLKTDSSKTCFINMYIRQHISNITDLRNKLRIVFGGNCIKMFVSVLFLPPQGCRGIVFTHGVRMGGRASGKKFVQALSQQP